MRSSKTVQPTTEIPLKALRGARHPSLTPCHGSIVLQNSLLHRELAILETLNAFSTHRFLPRRARNDATQ
jgi:hypothetical protein